MKYLRPRRNKIQLFVNMNFKVISGRGSTATVLDDGDVRKLLTSLELSRPITAVKKLFTVAQPKTSFQRHPSVTNLSEVYGSIESYVFACLYKSSHMHTYTRTPTYVFKHFKLDVFMIFLTFHFPQWIHKQFLLLYNFQI